MTVYRFGERKVNQTTSSECTEWVMVGLHDGTRLEMTSNHPVECFLADNPDGSSRCALGPGRR